MLIWGIIVGLLVLFAVFCIIYDNKNYNDWAMPATFITGFVVMIIGLVMLIQGLEISNNISVFEKQSAYLQAHEVVDPVENAAISNKKIELNDWLYSAQWAKNKFGIFSMYPNSILDLEPIQ
jgi:hypothetical protein